MVMVRKRRRKRREGRRSEEQKQLRERKSALETKKLGFNKKKSISAGEISEW